APPRRGCDSRAGGGPSLSDPPPPSLPRARNWTRSARTPILLRLSPGVLSSPGALFSEPPMLTPPPFLRSLQQFSAWRSQTVTSMNSVSSLRSPSLLVQTRLVAIRRSVTAEPLGVYRSFGSNVRFPIKKTLFNAAIEQSLPQVTGHRSRKPQRLLHP